SEHEERRNERAQHENEGSPPMVERDQLLEWARPQASLLHSLEIDHQPPGTVWKKEGNGPASRGMVVIFPTRDKRPPFSSTGLTRPQGPGSPKSQELAATHKKRRHWKRALGLCHECTRWRSNISPFGALSS